MFLQALAAHRWRYAICLAAACYCLLALTSIWANPGLHYDEAIDVLGAVHLHHSRAELSLPHDPGTWLCVNSRCFPLMSARYIGSVKEYLCLPLFALFGPSAEIVRLASMLLAAAGILGLSALAARCLGPPAGAAVAWTLALSPSYLDQTVFDNGSVAPWMFFFGLACFAVARYLRAPGAKAAFCLGLACGAGVWARANFAWLLSAMALALLVARGWRPPGLEARGRDGWRRTAWQPPLPRVSVELGRRHMGSRSTARRHGEPGTTLA